MTHAPIGFVGLGTMGAGMVTNLLRAGHPVTGYNRNRERARPLEALGMRSASTLQEVATGAQLVFLCVADDVAAQAVALGEGGVIASLRTGALLVDTGTTSLERTRDLQQACAAQGVSFVDAPITGSKLGAENGTLTFMAGGSAEHVDRLAPYFQAMGRHAVHVGERVGDGQIAKSCLNMTQAVVLEGVLEGYTLAAKLGISLERLAEVFENSAGKTGVGSFKTPYLFRGDFQPHFRLALMHKDLHLALGEAARHSLPLPAAAATRVVYDQGMAEGLGNDDFLVLARLLERWGHVRLRSDPPTRST